MLRLLAARGLQGNPRGPPYDPAHADAIETEPGRGCGTELAAPDEARKDRDECDLRRLRPLRRIPAEAASLLSRTGLGEIDQPRAVRDYRSIRAQPFPGVGTNRVRDRRREHPDPRPVRRLRLLAATSAGRVGSHGDGRLDQLRCRGLAGRPRRRGIRHRRRDPQLHRRTPRNPRIHTALHNLAQAIASTVGVAALSLLSMPLWVFFLFAIRLRM